MATTSRKYAKWEKMNVILRSLTSRMGITEKFLNFDEVCWRNGPNFEDGGQSKLVI